MRQISQRARLAVLATIALGVALSLPALRAGFFHDDYFHFLIFEKVLPATGWIDLYRVVPGWPNSAGPTQGDFLPWWSASPSVEYFRPIASLSLLLDRALFGRSGLGFHAT